jgi:FtsH-binding integral membrane protein
MTANRPVAENRLERVLGFMVLGIVGLSVVCFLIIIFATLAGVDPSDYANGPWLLISLIPWFGLPLAMILMIVLFVVVALRRGRAAKDAVQ